MSAALRTLDGDSNLGAELADALDSQASDSTTELLIDRKGRRRHSRVRLAGGEALFIKRFRRFTSKHRSRERLKWRLGLDAAHREWRALRALHAGGIAVPEPRALVELGDGELVLATRFLPGRTLTDWLPGETPGRRALLKEIGSVVARFHASGFTHGDLHWGNVLVTESGPVLLDFQSSRRSRGRRARLRDLGELDYSLSRDVSLADRLRLRRAGLGIEGDLDRAAREGLRAVGRAASARGRAHASSRTRRCLRPGGTSATFRLGPLRGLRLRGIDARALAAALESPGIVLKESGRSQVRRVETDELCAIVKTFPRPDLGRRMADALRGSPARRGWRGGHGLRIRGIDAAQPIAFLERRRLGLPDGSYLFLEDLSAAPTADDGAADGPADEDVVDALTRLALDLHRRGVVHGDLKASHVFLEPRGPRLEPRLIDLEGVRFPRRLTDRQRIRALAELNASLSDAIPDALRHRAFARYAGQLPFRGDPKDALRRIVELSMARAHRWSGTGCALAQGRDLVNRGA